MKTATWKIAAQIRPPWLKSSAPAVNNRQGEAISFLHGVLLSSARQLPLIAFMNETALDPSPVTAAPSAAHAHRILIVTPTLGTSSYLDETVRGVTSLPVPFLHVLVTPAPMVESLQARYPHAIVLADAGKAAAIYGAINVALRSSGDDWEWFTYINDDDELGPGFGRMAQEHFARANPEPVVYGDVRIIDDEGRRSASCRWSATSRKSPRCCAPASARSISRGCFFIARS